MSCIPMGVVLCFVLALVPLGRVLKDIQSKITAYIEGCKKLGIPSHELFTVKDLHSEDYLLGVRSA